MADGVLHFIHESNPYPPGKHPSLLSEKEISDIFTGLMSKVSMRIPVP
jgi:hypothetical protein